jgi:5-dehydro-4-deoxyglucarate dehydratase
MSVQDLSGVLFFPVTPFTAAGQVDTCSLAEHLRRGLAAGAGGVFAACGTGEFHALDLGEHGRVVRTAVEVTRGVVPVLAGAGGQLAMARQFARTAQEAGADGLLLMPPYLVAAPPAGLVAYIGAIVGATELPLIAYQRGNAVFDPETVAELAGMPRVVGFKDGLGDVDLLSRIVVTVRRALDGEGKQFQFFNGTPTAEVSVPAYRALGVELYSSAVFCFVPEVALGFYDAAWKSTRPANSTAASGPCWPARPARTSTGWARTRTEPVTAPCSDHDHRDHCGGRYEVRLFHPRLPGTATGGHAGPGRPGRV